MNYLAHLHLGGQRPGQLLGSLYGDFVKGRLQGQFDPEIETAIQLHRSIDVFTDRHPLVDASLSRFSLTRRRYAGIVLDVFSTTAWRGTGCCTPISRWSISPRTCTGCCPVNGSCPNGWRKSHRTWCQ
jgi:hypothetical protein